MKVAIVGAGQVGASCAHSMVCLTPTPFELVLLDKDEERAKGVAFDISDGCFATPILGSGAEEHHYHEHLRGASVVFVTAGFRENTIPEAIDRNDEEGRLRLIPSNAPVYAEVIPLIASAAPDAIIIVVTDPPDPLADLARSLTDTNLVLSSGTFLDTYRFRRQIAQHLNCDSKSVDAYVLGDHGTTAVYAWSSATVGGQPVESILDETQRAKVEQRVKNSNITIIDGTGASQRGIGFAVARILRAILHDTGLVYPIGQFQREHGVTLSLPSMIGRGGVSRVFQPMLSDEEQEALRASAAVIAAAGARAKKLASVIEAEEQQVELTPPPPKLPTKHRAANRTPDERFPK